MLFIIGVAVFIFVAVDRTGDFVQEFGTTQFTEDLPAGPRLLDTSGTISGLNGVQTLSFEVADRTDVQIDVLGQGGFDPVITLVADSGTILGSDDDGGTAVLASRLNQLLDRGTYTLEVRGFGDATGSFRAVVTDL
ncbi:MAG: DVUA0089 family protein [Euzebya sp.]